MHFASMSLGIFDFLIEWLTQFLIWIIGWVFDLINALLADLFYSIGTSFLTIVDMLQNVFKKLCGMDVYWVGNERVEGLDPLLQLFTNGTVMQVLIALTLVAVVMVIVAAVIQIIRVEFTTEGSKNSKGQIFGQALKSLLMFVLVPICCIGGVGLTNALLQTIDRATNLSTGQASLGSSIFVSAASNTSRIRAGENLTEPLLRAVGINGTINETNREECAQLVDTAFKENTVDYSALSGLDDALNTIGQSQYERLSLVKLYYNHYEMNYILYIGAGIIAAYTMISVTFGMIMRLFKGVILFMISPPMVALMPLDGGSAFKQWRTAFVKQILSAYGTIVALNLLFLVLPIVENIKLFQPLTGGSGGFDFNGANSFVQILVTLTGLFMLKDLTGIIANMIGADDARASGEGMAKKVGSTVAKVGLIATGVGAMGAGAIAGVGAKAAMASGHTGLASKLSATSNTLSKYGQKGVGRLGKALNQGISTITGGEIKGPFSEETDINKAVEARENKAKDRKKRIESGQGTIGDYINKGISDSGFGKVTGHIATGGATTTKKIGENKQESNANQLGMGQTLLEEKTRNENLAKLTDVSVAGNLFGELKNALNDLATASTDTERFNAADNVNNLIEAIKQQGGTFEEMKDLLIKLTSIQTSLNGAGSATDKQNYAMSTLDVATGEIKGVTDGYLSNINSAANSNAATANSFMSAINVTVDSDGSIKSTGDLKLLEKDLELKINDLATRMKTASSSSVASADVSKESKRLLEEVKKQVEKIANDKK